MAKDLIFSLKGKDFSLNPTKFERKKVYGWTELQVKSAKGDICRSVGLDNTGTTIIPKGAIKNGIIDEDGLWLDKSELFPVDEAGNEITPVASSFDAPISLAEKVSEEFFLDHIINSIYILSGDNESELIKTIGNDIYSFPFSYRSSLETSTGFLLSNGTNVYLFSGEKANFEFIGLKEEAVLDEPDDEVVEETDELDFSMM
jgi:hypothetical protein